jgi:hypothetical protein
MILDQKFAFARSEYQQFINNISSSVQTTIRISLFCVNLSFRCTRSAIRFHLLLASARINVAKCFSLRRRRRNERGKLCVLVEWRAPVIVFGMRLRYATRSSRRLKDCTINERCVYMYIFVYRKIHARLKTQDIVLFFSRLVCILS